MLYMTILTKKYRINFTIYKTTIGNIFTYIMIFFAIILLILLVIYGVKYKEGYVNKKVCFITSIYGNYEASCKKYIEQTIPTDFICFTDSTNIEKNGWIIDNTPYHLTNKSPLDNDSYTNSLTNNKHTFNIAKYYKQQFQNIPRLKDYDVIIWLDATIEINNPSVSEYILNNIYKHKIIGWAHEERNGILKNEVDASDMIRYTSTFWNNQEQPYQDIFKQYDDYVDLGYNDNYLKENSVYNEVNNKNIGVWITCFVAFLNHDNGVTNFLNDWYLQTLTYTTQDQISFSYTCYKTKMIPYTLPDNEINGAEPHKSTDFYIKHNHGK